MFALSSSSLPETSSALRDALEESLARALESASPMVAIDDGNFPAIAALRISLDQARANGPFVRQPVVRGKIEPALQVDRFEISGRPFFVQRAAINLDFAARQIRIGQTRDENGNVVLVPQDAAEGNIEIALAIRDLEALILALGRGEASRQGITLESLQIELKAESERALDLVANVRAKKLFLTAAIKISGRVEIDDRLNAHISRLNCDGEGNLGTLACGFLGPHLQRFEKSNFPLAAFSLGETKLRDLRVTTDDGLRVTARFGRDAA